MSRYNNLMVWGMIPNKGESCIVGNDVQYVVTNRGSIHISDNGSGFIADCYHVGRLLIMPDGDMFRVCMVGHRGISLSEGKYLNTTWDMWRNMYSFKMYDRLSHKNFNRLFEDIIGYLHIRGIMDYGEDYQIKDKLLACLPFEKFKKTEKGDYDVVLTKTHKWMEREHFPMLLRGHCGRSIDGDNGSSIWAVKFGNICGTIKLLGGGIGDLYNCTKASLWIDNDTWPYTEVIDVPMDLKYYEKVRYVLDNNKYEGPSVDYFKLRFPD